MRKKIFVGLLCLVYGFIVQAQPGKEAWHWQFGYGTSLDFSSGSPVLGSSSTDTEEGTASISDANTGQLLFYTDGVSVWDKNNNQMPSGSGLLGNFSTTQSALIIPKPGSTTLYYIITCDVQGGPGGVCYSEVDLSLNGGLGDVTVLNKLLTAAPTTEKLVGLKHCNGQDYWIIDHPSGSNQFNAYLVTSAGIATKPVVSKTGTIQAGTAGSYDGNAGYLKASPDGKKLAVCISGIPVFELFDFNAFNGQVTHPTTIQLKVEEGNQGYGVSFSPDNSKVYFNTLYSDGSTPVIGHAYLYQFDLSSGVDSTIIASKTLIASDVGGYSEYGAMQIGPDGKIYMTWNETVSYLAPKHLSIINNPNALGSACNFQAYGITLLPNEDGIGLPNFIDANSASTIYQSFPLAQCSTFTTDTLFGEKGLPNYLWSTGDNTQQLIINSPGTYWVTSTADGCVINDTFHVFTINPATVSVLKDTSSCSVIPGYQANATYTGAQAYQWYDASTNPVKTFQTSGTYSLNIYFLGGCIVNNHFNLGLHALPQVHLGNDTFVCGFINPAIPLNAGAGNGFTYNWSTTAATQSISVNTNGTYWVKVSSAPNCSSIDSIHIMSLAANKHYRHDTVFCQANQFPLLLTPQSVPGNNTNYFWSDGTNNPTDLVTSPGHYFTDIAILNFYTKGSVCLLKDSFYVILDTMQPHITNALICNKQPISVNAGNGYSSYAWSTGASSSTALIDSIGTYWVKVSSTGLCFNTDTFRVTASTVVKPSMADLIQCNNPAPVILNAGSGYSNYLWSTGASTASVSINTSNIYWVRVANSQGCQVSDTVSVNFYTSPAVTILTDTSMLCNHAPLPIDATYPGAVSYAWNDGSSTPIHAIQTAGIYWVAYTFSTSCVSTDSFAFVLKPVLYSDSIANIITPNNDGINDVLDFSVYHFPNMQLAIFNRWGIQIAESNDPDYTWKPTCDDGTYYYVLSYIADCTNKQKSLKGFFTILR